MRLYPTPHGLKNWLLQQSPQDGNSIVKTELRCSNERRISRRSRGWGECGWAKRAGAAADRSHDQKHEAAPDSSVCWRLRWFDQVKVGCARGSRPQCRWPEHSTARIRRGNNSRHADRSHDGPTIKPRLPSQRVRQLTFLQSPILGSGHRLDVPALGAGQTDAQAGQLAARPGSS